MTTTDVTFDEDYGNTPTPECHFSISRSDDLFIARTDKMEESVENKILFNDPARPSDVAKVVASQPIRSK